MLLTVVQSANFSPGQGMGRWVMGHENRMGHMGHGSLGVDPWPITFYSAQHCKSCTSYGNSVHLSVRLSVYLAHAGIVSKRRHVARCSLQLRIAKCVQFCRNQKYSPGTTLPSEILAPSDLLSPDSSESWHVLPCSASTIRASEKSSIMAHRKFYTGFPTSHQPTFYAAPNFLKIGINYLNLSSFGQFRQCRTKSLLQSFII